MLGPKVAAWRSKPYRMFVASQECFGCRIVGYSQAAHENAGKGGALKTGDDRTFPLCCTRPGKIGCHVEHDQCIDMTRDERNEKAAKWVAEMQARAREVGWPLPYAARPRSDRAGEHELQPEASEQD